MHKDASEKEAQMSDQAPAEHVGGALSAGAVSAGNVMKQHAHKRTIHKYSN